MNTTGSYCSNPVVLVVVISGVASAVTVVDLTPVYIAPNVLPLTGTVKLGLEYTSNSVGLITFK